jgi:hypothetical protein
LASAKIKITNIWDSTYDEADNVPTEKELNSLSLLVPLLPYLKKIPYCSLQNHSGTRYDSWISEFFLYKDNLFNGYISLSPELAPDMENRLLKKFPQPNPLFIINLLQMGTLKKFKKL